jgi:putative ABC transport system permease protein
MTKMIKKNNFMLLTNLKVFWKFLTRNKVYTAINYVGFTVALVFVILLGLYVAGESRVDKFHTKGDRIFRLVQGDGHNTWPAKMGEEIAARYPEVESFVRMSDEFFTIDKGDGSEKIRANALVVDSTFFSVFSFPLVAGDPARQLQTSTDITLSESFAVRLFGAEDPIGKPLSLEGEPRIVTGVARDFYDSHFATPDIIVNFSGHINPYYFSNYNSSNFVLYILQREGSDITSKADDMAAWFKEFFWIYQHGMQDKVAFEPLTESYYNANNSWRPTVYHTGNRQFIWSLVAAVMAILLFAVINYVNLSVALGGFRAREAAMRRLLGGTRRGLLAGYVLESVMFCMAAVAVALVLAVAAEPMFNGVVGSRISVAGALLDPVAIAVLVGSTLLLGVVSGIYPSLVVTRVRPIDVVKGEFSRKTRMVYSRLFIGLQFCLTIILIGCALTIHRQTSFMRTSDLGFDKQNLLTFDNNLSLEQLPGFRDRLMQIPGVEMVSFSDGTPVNGGNNNTNNYDDGSTIAFQVFLGDSLLFPILGVEVLSRTGNAADSALWINQTAARMLGLAADADRFEFNDRIVGLAGIVRDFHIRDLGEELSPMVLGSFKTLNDSTWDILVKVAAGNPAETYKAVEAAYLDYNGGRPFESGFVDAAIDDWYDEQRRTGTLIGGFSLLAVVISAMGLVAMTTYFMRQRQRDIAVRKVFGATNSQVLKRLVGGFMRIVAVAFVVAVPVVWWLMREWLSTFAYRISLGWTIFAVAGLSVGAVAFAAVIWQSLAAARRPPVASLKTE